MTTWTSLLKIVEKNLDDAEKEYESALAKKAKASDALDALVKK